MVLLVSSMTISSSGPYQAENKCKGLRHVVDVEVGLLPPDKGRVPQLSIWDPKNGFCPKH